MHRCKELWKSIVDFLINKLGGVTKEEHEAVLNALLLKERQHIHIDKRAMRTATIVAEGRWDACMPVGGRARKLLAEEIGLKMLKEGLLHFDVSMDNEPGAPIDVNCIRATARVVEPSAKGFGYEAEGYFIDDDLIHVNPH